MSSVAPEGSVADAVPKKGKAGIVLAIVAVIVLVAGAAVAGTLLGPKLLSRAKAPEPAPEKAAAHAEKIGETTELNPILVDTRSADGTLHHLKVVLAVELDETTPKAEFMKFAPRGREATIAYLRSQTFENVSASD